MKGKTLKKFIIILLFSIIIMITNNIYASNFNTSLEIDSNNQDKNNIVLILKVKDVNFENTISTIEGNLEYNKEIFSEVTIENLNGWSIVYNNEEKANGKFIGFKVSDEEIKQEELCKITLQLKENIKDSNTQISIKNIKSADGDNLVATDDKTINIKIKDSFISDAKEEKVSINDKNILKYVFVLVIIVLVVTIFTSISYLVQKYRLKKLYNKTKYKD